MTQRSVDKNEIAKNAFNTNAEAYAAKFSELTLYRHAFEEFARLLQNDQHILDVGCGPGNVAKFLLSTNDTLKITGVDFAPEMIALAKQKVPSATFNVQDMRTIDFPPACFDAIVASFCLPFLYNDEAALFIETLATMLRTAGYLYLSTMEGDGWRYEKTSFGGDTTFFFNYFKRVFLCDAFHRNHLHIVTEWCQDYPVAHGASPFKEMLFILHKQPGGTL